MKTVNPSTSLRINGERSRTIKFYTLGCKVNQYETQAIRESFLAAGYRELEDGRSADIYVINTCTVTHRADSDSLHLIRRAKKENLQSKIIVTGCLVELDADKINATGCVNLIVKNRDKERVVELLDEHNEPSVSRGITNFAGHTRAFLKIQDGCDNSCSYCKVPLVRGRSRSKPLDLIIEEAGSLARNGFKEIVLCGICLGAYGRDLHTQLSLVGVISALEQIEGLWRIRLSSIEAGDVSAELIEKMAQSRKLCRHLHIPLQSGDDEILKRMNRKYRRDDYLNLIQRIKRKIPEIAITTDVLVGFPGEEEAQFENTVDLVKKVLPLKVHAFCYSKRKEVPAACDTRPEVNPAIIRERSLRLQNAAQQCSLFFAEQFLDKKMEALIEGRLRGKPNVWEGRTDNYIKVRVESRLDLKGKPVFLRLKKATPDFILSDLC
jgi:threonylcarbamoyladenosine tRNA methylthiotransferase MtaB